MRFFIYIFLVLNSFLGFSQTEVTYLNYDPFFEDSVINKQTTVKPLITDHATSPGWNLCNKNEKTTNSLKLFPAVNSVGGAFQNHNNWKDSYRLGAGFGFSSKIGTKLHFRGNILASYYENNSPSELSNSVLQNTYLHNNNGGSFREVQPRFRLSYTPNRHFNFQAGVDQQFIGEGNRSMLLSDYSSPHPFFQLRSSIWRIEFVNLYQFFRENVTSTARKKFASTHMLNYQVTDKLQIGLFESVVFEPKDTSLNRGYELEYLNPFLFYRPTEYSIGSQDRLLIGLNLSYTFKNLMIYGQFTLDDFVLNEIVERSRWWANKYGGQFGFKGKKQLNKSQLRYRSEINFARPFTYTHLSEGTNYGNQGISLAHPLGANFVESYTEAALHFENDLTLSTQIMFAQQGGQDADATTTYGSDIYQPYTDRPFEYGYYIGANGRLNRLRVTVELNYPILRKIALVSFIRPGIEFSQMNDNPYQSSLLIYGGLRTNLWNDREFSF
ncbi:MAG: hypothetical protein WED10_06145 [Brumimicrobium sp.]